MKRFLYIFVCLVINRFQVTICFNNDFQPLDDDSYNYDRNYASFDVSDNLSLLNEDNRKELKGQNDQYESEKLAGDMTNLFGENVHFHQSNNYNNFGRRFVLQYPYSNGSKINQNQLKPSESHLTPVKAPPELVLAVAKESAKQQASNPVNPVPQIIEKAILRSGDYWNAVWKEDVIKTNNVLRSAKSDKTNRVVEVVQAKVSPGSKLFRLLSVLKQLSPRLLYVINKGKKK